MFDELQWKPTYYVMTDPILFTNLRKREHIVVKDFSQKYSIVNSINREKSIDDEKIMYITNCWLDHVYHLGKVNDLSIMKNLMQEFMIIVQLRRNVFITLCTQGVMRYIY